MSGRKDTTFISNTRQFLLFNNEKAQLKGSALTLKCPPPSTFRLSQTKFNFQFSARLCRFYKGDSRLKESSIFNFQFDLVVLASVIVTLGEGLAGNLAALTVLDGDGLHGARFTQGECRAVERALSRRR